MINQTAAGTAWRFGRIGDFVTFAAPTPAHPWPLLVWPDRGLGIADPHLRAFYDVIADAMKHPTYPHGCTPRQWFPWSPARLDRDEGFVYVSGPARAEQPAIGYRPATGVRVAVADLRHLRIRLAVHLGRHGRL